MHDVDATASVSVEELVATPVPSRTRSRPVQVDDAAVSPVATSRVDDDVVPAPPSRSRRWPLALLGLGVAAAAVIAVVAGTSTSTPTADPPPGVATQQPVETRETQPRVERPHDEPDPQREAELRRQAEARAAEEACVAAARDGSPDVWRRLVAEHPDAGCAPSARQRLELYALEPRARLDAIAERLEAPERAPNDLDPPGLLALATEALHALAPEVRWHVDHLIRIGPDLLSAAREDEIPVEAPARAVLLVQPGRYVLQQGIRLRGRRELALVAGPEVEIFARSGQAVLAVSNSQDLLLWGLYLNHHEIDTSGFRVDRNDCLYDRYHPRIKESDVVDVIDSRGVTIRRSDLEGTGFIGVKAVRSRDVVVADTVIHDCISAAIHLEDSALVANNVLIYRVGARAYRTKFKCIPGNDALCKNTSPQQYGFSLYSATFKTAVFVDPASSLSMARATVVVPEALKRSQAFEIEGQLVLEESLVQHADGLLKASGDRARVTIARTCSDAPEKSAAGARLEDDRLGVALRYPEPAGDVSFVNRPEVAPGCLGYGSDLGREGIPRHAKPEPNEQPEKEGRDADEPSRRAPQPAEQERPTPAPKAASGSGSSSGTCDKGEVSTVVRRQQRAVQACYEQRLAARPDLAGSLTVSWTIQPDGSVGSASAVADTLGDASFSACVLRVVQRMKFPKPKGGVCVIRWPYVFRTK
ncbi:MAG: hypothetical protein EP329_03325 [Deltaproteobacteria bacterium]|nr:MAG: hypothetical protein EP329_03325 [Deltaproteobacteria bacterium]